MCECVWRRASFCEIYVVHIFWGTRYFINRPNFYHSLIPVLKVSLIISLCIGHAIYIFLLIYWYFFNVACWETNYMQNKISLELCPVPWLHVYVLIQNACEIYIEASTSLKCSEVHLKPIRRCFNNIGIKILKKSQICHLLTGLGFVSIWLNVI